MDPVLAGNKSTNLQAKNLVLSLMEKPEKTTAPNCSKFGMKSNQSLDVVVFQRVLNVWDVLT